jgi:hypothetical protein
MATQATTSSTITIQGTGFYPSGSVNIVFTTNAGTTTTVTTTASSSGAISVSVSAASINGILTATSLSMYAVDESYNVQSNTVSLALNPITVNPVLAQPTGSITVVTY